MVRVGWFSATCMGASMCVPRCIVFSISLTRTPSLAWKYTVRTLRMAEDGHSGMPWHQLWLGLKNSSELVLVGLLPFLGAATESMFSLLRNFCQIQFDRIPKDPA